MLFKFLKDSDVKSSEITPENMYHNRRDFIQNSLKVGIGMTGIAAGLGGNLGRNLGFDAMTFAEAHAEDIALGQPLDNIVHSSLYNTDEKTTSYRNITTYNNFYELGSGKLDPSHNAARLRPAPWTVKVDGHVEKAGDYAIEDLIKPHKLQERIYRMRCVEAWSMVIPWVGIPLGDIIKELRPTSAAKYIVFETLVDPKQMPGQNRQVIYWPYVEGLRMDEAMNPLTLMAVGLYGATLPNQNGAPMRLVVPWKYGFKGIKSIVRMSFVETQPNNSWHRLAANEYGFYANVNPTVDHPRWSQASERRIGEFRRRATLMFNGYSQEVAHMYSGMDLKKFF